jgi:arylsulfatase
MRFAPMPNWRNTVPKQPDEPSAPKGAPNIVIIVLDDVGFADLGCYGSEIATPCMDRLARNGVRYSNFHVTSMCSPTRACLLTGRNAHAVGMGIIAEWSSGYPGYQGQVAAQAATIPEVLRDHAYGTYAVGKWHLTNMANYGAAGPHDNWPLGRGFARWYGFHGSLTDQWNPELYQDNQPVHLLPRESYHLSSDLVDHSIANIRDHWTTSHNRHGILQTDGTDRRKPCDLP